MVQFDQTYVVFASWIDPVTIIIASSNEPEFTAIGLSDSTRAPIILELLEVVFE
jgi:hypothetical protein